MPRLVPSIWREGRSVRWEGPAGGPARRVSGGKTRRDREKKKVAAETYLKLIKISDSGPPHSSRLLVVLGEYVTHSE